VAGEMKFLGGEPCAPVQVGKRIKQLN